LINIESDIKDVLSQEQLDTVLALCHELSNIRVNDYQLVVDIRAWRHAVRLRTSLAKPTETLPEIECTYILEPDEINDAYTTEVFNTVRKALVCAAGITPYEI